MGASTSWCRGFTGWLQAQWRRYHDRVRWLEVMAIRHGAATIIQRMWRGYKTYSEYLEWLVLQVPCCHNTCAYFRCRLARYWTMHSTAFITHLPWRVIKRITSFLHPSARRALCNTCTQLRMAVGRGTRVLRLTFPPLDVTASRLARVFVVRHKIRVLTARRSPGFCTTDKLGSVGAAMLGGALDIGAGLSPRGLCIQVLDLSFQNVLDDGARALGPGLLALSTSLTRYRHR